MSGLFIGCGISRIIPCRFPRSSCLTFSFDLFTHYPLPDSTRRFLQAPHMLIRTPSHRKLHHRLVLILTQISFPSSRSVNFPRPQKSAIAVPRLSACNFTRVCVRYGMTGRSVMRKRYSVMSLDPHTRSCTRSS